VADPEILKGGGAKTMYQPRGGGEDNVSAPSSFIAKAHNELYTCIIWEKYEDNGGRPPSPPRRSPLNPPQWRQYLSSKLSQHGVGVNV